MTPEESVLTYVLNALRGITKANGYTVTILTVELKNQFLRNLNIGDLPAILVSLGRDDYDREAFGSGDSNTHYRFMDLMLFVYMIDEADATVPGSAVKTAIMAALGKNRCAADGKWPWDIIVGPVNYSEFERSENRIGQFTMPIRARYSYSPGEL
jgi:hypothetical protein